MAVSVKAAIAGGLLLAGLAAWQYKAVSEAQRHIAALHQQLGSLRHQLSDRSNADYEVQRQACSDRSQHYFT